jgi:thiol-disulfide isomerase/thioredoxin
LLAQEVIDEYGDNVEFVEENFGESELADRFGVKRYPAVFVNEVLVARPSDFGFYGTEGKGSDRGRYTPWRDAKSHAKFKQDLKRMLDLAFQDSAALASTYGVEADTSLEIGSLPEFTLTDLQGQPIRSADLEGQVVVVEFWATWCPPCRSTLTWLDALQKENPNRLTVLAVAIESEDLAVRDMVTSMGLSQTVVKGSNDLAIQFGDITSVPTMFVFTPEGKTATVYYGAPPDLHEQAGTLIESLIR